MCQLLDVWTIVFVDGIVKHMKSKAGPSFKELLTVADAEKFLANSEHSIVGMYCLQFLFDFCHRKCIQIHRGNGAVAFMVCYV